MNKFKVGDRVRLIENLQDAGVISDITESRHTVLVKFSNRHWWYHYSHLELDKDLSILKCECPKCK